MAFQESVLDGIELTRENFSKPPLEMGIVPFWFWNGDMDKEEMEWQLREYHDRGVRSLFIHGRMGLGIGYLSDEWFDRVKFCVEKAREIGIDAWVYDEMDWPSGTAQRQVIEADPNLGQRYLQLVPLRLEGPIFTFLEAHDDRYVETGNSKPIAAYGVRGEEYDTVIEDTIDLHKNLAWEKTIAWEAPEGDWVLMYFLEKEAPFYIDTLDPASTEKFIELTHERYKDVVGHEFGKTVPGFFTDEPAMYYYHVGVLNYVIPWSKQMFKIFRERRGYSLKPHLPALYKDVGEKTAQIRYDFWRTLTEQYAETYYKRIRDWCDENGVIFTGHLLFEEHLRLAARCEGNFFKYLQHMHLIGVDHLYPKIGSRDAPDQHVALKVGSSAAHHFGSARLLCESMGGTYWDCTLERMKWINNWEYVLGVNLFNNHGYHYTIEGERKRDWPPSQFYHHTWWKYYDRFTEYNARLSHLLSGGRHVAKVLMLYPINSIWVDYVPQEQTRIGETIEEDFKFLTDILLRMHYDFDYVDEDVLADAEVEAGKIRIADETFEILILPPLTHIKESSYKKIRAFLDGGGSVIADALVPVGLLEAGGNGEVARLDEFLGLDGHEILSRFKAHREEPFSVDHRKEYGNFYYFRGEGLYSRMVKAEKLAHGNPEAKLLQEFMMREAGVDAGVTLDEYLEREAALQEKREEALRSVLHACAPPDVEISDEDVFYLHRMKDDFDIYYLVNTSQEDKGAVEISLEKLGRPELWDPNTGKTSPIHVHSVRNGRLHVTLDFPPSEAHVIVLRDDLETPYITESNLDITEFDGGRIVGYSRETHDEAIARIVTEEGGRTLSARGRKPLDAITFPAPGAWQAEGDNVLAISHYRMTMEDDESFTAPEHDDSEWLDVEMGAWEPQLPYERDEETYPVTLWYRTSFEVRAVPETPRILIDGFSGSEYRLFVNGEEITDRGRRSYLDAEIREVDVTLQKGINVVAVRLAATRPTDGMLDLLKVIGRFGVEDDTIVAAPSNVEYGDWVEQGYPYYSGTGVYTVEVEVPSEYVGTGRVWFEADCGEDVLEVSVNGSEPLVVPWHPYRLDVTEHLREGANSFEVKVTNTLINVLEGEPKPSGLFEAPWLIHEHRYELTDVGTGDGRDGRTGVSREIGELESGDRRE